MDELARSLDGQSSVSGAELASSIVSGLAGDDGSDGRVGADDSQGALVRAVGQPAPLLHVFLRSLANAGRLAREQTEIAAATMNWYSRFWAAHNDFAQSEHWKLSVMRSLADYAEGTRVGSFRPYYEELAISRRVFQQWQTSIGVDDLGAFRANGRWRGPVVLLRAFEDAVLIGDPGPWDAQGDRHICDSYCWFLLGDTGYGQFDFSLCHICIGPDEGGCGAVLVDVRD